MNVLGKEPRIFVCKWNSVATAIHEQAKTEYKKKKCEDFFIVLQEAADADFVKGNPRNLRNVTIIVMCVF